PRCLGLRTWLSAEDTVESCLALRHPKAVTLMGKDFVEGDPAWHVRVKNKYDDTFDFWIDAAHQERLLRHAHGKDVATSRYDDGKAIPTEVVTTEYHQGKLLTRNRYVRSNAELNLPIDSTLWTLAGLGIPVGTTVSDDRNS